MPALVNIVAVNSRIIVAHFKGKTDLWFISAYAPQADHDESTKDDFYKALQQTIQGIPGEYFG